MVYSYLHLHYVNQLVAIYIQEKENLVNVYTAQSSMPVHNIGNQ